MKSPSTPPVQIAWAALATAALLPALSLLPGSAAAQDGPEHAPLPLAQLMEINSVVGGEGPLWSPDGSRILFASGLGGGGFMTLDPEGGFPRRIPVDVGAAGHFLASHQAAWSPDGDWLAYISDKTGRPEIWVWSRDTGREIQLTDLDARVTSQSWSADGRWIAFSGDRHGNMDVWRVSVPEGRVQRLTRSEAYEVYPSWTPDGRILFVRLDERWADHDVIEIAPDGSDPRTVVRDTDFFDYGAGAKFGYPLASPDGEGVLFRSHRSGWINYWIAPRGGGEPRPVVLAEGDQYGARWSPDGRWIAYTENHNGAHDLRIVPADGGEPRVLVAPETGVVSRPDWSPDGRSIVYTFGDLTTPRDLFVVEVESGETRRLTRSMPEGSLEEQLVVPEKIAYSSTDGFTIQAYVYRPPGLAPGERVPGIVWSHGGPTSQFNDTFQQHVQFFVQRGYGVLLPNVRGSSGYGKAFEDANNGCWSHCDLEDVVAAADYLRGLSWIDPDRLGITGTSYGGIMSMAAATFAPGVFQASIPSSGYADWIAFYHGENELRHVKLLEYELGTLEGNRDVWEAASAVYSVEDVGTPIFMVHGEGRYPGSPQSEIFAQALENHYKPFRYKTYPNEHYYVGGRANREEMLQDMLDFFEDTLKDDIVR